MFDKANNVCYSLFYFFHVKTVKCTTCILPGIANPVRLKGAARLNKVIKFMVKVTLESSGGDLSKKIV